MIARNMWNYISGQRLSVHNDISDSLADSFWILDSDFIDRSAETTGDGIFLPLRTDARINLQTLVGRLDSENELGDGIPVPGSGSGKPAVLGFTRTGRILTGYHL